MQAFRLAAENLRAETHQLEFQAARVVKLVDTGDLKSPDPNRSCRFESGPGHQAEAYLSLVSDREMSRFSAMRMSLTNDRCDGSHRISLAL